MTIAATIETMEMRPNSLTKPSEAQKANCSVRMIEYATYERNVALATLQNGRLQAMFRINVPSGSAERTALRSATAGGPKRTPVKTVIATVTKATIPSRPMTTGLRKSDPPKIGMYGGQKQQERHVRDRHPPHGDPRALLGIARNLAAPRDVGNIDQAKRRERQARGPREVDGPGVRRRPEQHHDARQSECEARDHPRFAAPPRGVETVAEVSDERAATE